METIISFGWTALPDPPYSPDFTLSNYYLFGSMKEDLKGKHYASNEEVKTAVMKWLKEQSIEFYKAGTHAFIRLLLREKGDYVEKQGCDQLRDQLHFDV